MGWLHSHAESIGFWAAALTTLAFTPQVIRTWRSGGDGLSWMMLTLFGGGIGLWFVYGVLLNSAPMMVANGLTGAQVLFLVALKLVRPNSGAGRT
jgi:MtN3 and saliva related transmembrane protein